MVEGGGSYSAKDHNISSFGVITEEAFIGKFVALSPNHDALCITRVDEGSMAEVLSR